MEKKRIGFQTAVHIVSEELDRLRTTAESHHRVAILEVMGRHTGWIAVYGRMASLKGNKISSCSLKVAAEGIKTVDMRIYKVAQTFFS